MNDRLEKGRYAINTMLKTVRKLSTSIEQTKHVLTLMLLHSCR